MLIIDPELVYQFRKQTVCEWCGRRVKSGLAPHHVFTRGAGQLDVSFNLIALCPPTGNNCHQLFHDGHIMREDLLAKVAAREGVLQDDIVDAVHFLRRLPKRPSMQRLDWLLMELKDGPRALVQAAIFGGIGRAENKPDL